MVNISGSKSAVISGGGGKTARVQGNWSPFAVGRPILLLDAAKGITLNGANVSSWADQSGNGNDVVQATAANQPRYLAHLGENHMFLPGVDANNASTPNAAGLDITEDIDLRWEVAMDNWTDVVNPALIAKWATVGQQSYLFDLLADGKIRIIWSSDGTAVAGAVASTAATGFTDGTKHWARVTIDVDNGAGGHDIKFYTSDDGIIWAQLGDVVTTAGVTSIFNGTDILSIGSRSTGALPVTGKFYHAQVYDGIDGPLVFDADFTAESDGTTSFTESSLQAATVTINQSGGTPAQLVGFAKLSFDGLNEYLQSAAFASLQSQPNTIFSVFRRVLGGTRAVYDGVTINNRNVLGFNTTNFEMRADVAQNLLVVDNDVHVVAALFNGASSDTWFDGIQSTPGASPGTDALDGLTVGAWFGGNANWAGSIAYIVGYNSNLSDIAKNYIGNGLAARFGPIWTDI